MVKLLPTSPRTTTTTTHPPILSLSLPQSLTYYHYHQQPNQKKPPKIKKLKKNGPPNSLPPSNPRPTSKMVTLRRRGCARQHCASVLDATLQQTHLLCTSTRRDGALVAHLRHVDRAQFNTAHLRCLPYSRSRRL